MLILLFLAFPASAEAPIQYKLNRQPYLTQTTPAEIEHTKEVKKGQPINGNCVKYARSVRPDVPQGLWTLESKKRIVKTTKPSVNAVAVTAESASGHLAVVREIGESHILVEESGYSRGVTKRWVNKNNIIGYF